MENPYWVHHLDPVALAIGSTGLAIRWYGLAYFVGLLSAAALLSLYYKKQRSPLNPELQATYLTTGLFGVLIGGRLGSVLFYGLPPLEALQIWKPGMASHGGFVGVALGTLYFCWKYKQPFLSTSDIICTLPNVGFFLGRIANFINGELWGKVTTLRWAVIFPHSPLPLQPRHPSQLYEAALEGLFMLIYTQIRFWRSNVCNRYPGQLSGEFLCLYALARILCDCFREPDSASILHLPRGTFLSLILLGFGVGVVVVSRGRAKFKAKGRLRPLGSPTGSDF